MEMPTNQPESAAGFFAQEERILQDIAGGSGFNFRRGDKWAIEPETGNATFDPKFFEEKGYSPSQSLFASFHEIQAHLVDTASILSTAEGEKTYAALKKRMKKERVRIWENCRTDVKGNLGIFQFAPALSGEAERLYREKLWPEQDLTDKPKHLQFMYSILRTTMVPDEGVTVDPKVTEAIESLRTVKGKGGKTKDIIRMVTDPRVDPLLALKLSQKYIEPVIERLFEEDVREQKEKSKGEGEDGTPEKQQGDPQDSFSDDYQEFDEKHPEPFEDNDMDKKIKQAQKAHSEAERQKEAYEEEHGVTQEDVANYHKEYLKVEPYIEPLREIFRKIIEQRQVSKRRLAALKEEGVMIDPGLVTQTYIDTEAGIENPRTMKDFEGIMIDETIPTAFEVTVACDRTGSMQHGTKIPEQRRTALLLLEALKEFSDTTDDLGPLNPELLARSEIVSFGTDPDHTETLKPLTPTLSEKDRIGVFKALGICDSNINNEQTMFTNLYSSIMEEERKNPGYLARIKSGKLKKFVVVLTDGIVGNYQATRNQIGKLRDLGVVVAAVGITNEGQDAVTTYEPDGQVVREASDLPKTLQSLLAKYLDTLSIKKEDTA